LPATTYIYEDGLQSDRIITRKLVYEDHKAWAGFFKDKEAVEFFPAFGPGSDEDRSKHWINRQLNRYMDKRFGLQALIDKRTGQFIGQCGLISQEVEGEAEIEVGYHLFKQFWGQGYAPEAARLFINYAFVNNLAASVISIIDIRNTKSQRVADKNGLTREKQTRWSNLDVYIYRIQNCFR
jgi:ribosomal-protein-alanine N-acetyltransferase